MLAVHEVVRVPVDEEGREMEVPEHRHAAKATRFRLTTSPGSEAGTLFI